MAAINGQQIKKIYAIGNALGIVERGNEEDALHSLVAAITGERLCKGAHQQRGPGGNKRPAAAPGHPSPAP